jgi:protocatechuate 3,4-dioxygenase beta subunit
MKHYKVAVFPHKIKKSFRFAAYLRDYNERWSGCNIVDVEAEDGKDAKRKAIQIIRERLMSQKSEERESVCFTED